MNYLSGCLRILCHMATACASSASLLCHTFSNNKSVEEIIGTGSPSLIRMAPVVYFIYYICVCVFQFARLTYVLNHSVDRFSGLHWVEYTTNVLNDIIQR